MYNIWMVFWISFLYYVSNSASSNPSKYEYPQGSLACKTHYMTEMDCSNRYLVEIPFLDQNSTTVLDLSFNKLTEVSGAPFEQLPLLRGLYLSNNDISHLSSTAFRGIWLLIDLHLEFNKIKALPSGIFFNLKKLESINLFNNVLVTIPNEALELQTLQKIQFTAYGNISEISKIGFHRPNLKFFELEAILTSDIGNDTFHNLAHLPIEIFNFYPVNIPGRTYVVENGALAHLSYVTEMGTITRTFPALGSINAPLRSLSLLSYDQSLTFMNKTTLQGLGTHNSTLSHLSIKNQSLLERIEDDTFIWTPNLITLNLDNNELNYLAQYAFNGLVTLQELNLASNNLKAVPTHALEVFRESASLKYLDLSSNSISSNIANDAVLAISASLSTLKLSIKETSSVINITWVNEFQKLNYLFLKSTGPQNILDVSRHSTFSVQKLNIIDFTIIFPACSAFPNLEFLTMDNNVINNFPADLALHECSNLRVLSLSRFDSNINSFDEKHLNITFPFLQILKITQNKVPSFKPILSIKAPKLKLLDISSNLIKSIDIGIGQVFPNLTHLNISDNAIVSLSGLENCKFLEYLIAAGNQINVVPPWLLSSLKTLDLSNNLFTCSCDILPFKNWILFDNKTWLIPGEYVCASPDELIGISITAIDLDCRSHTAFYLAVSIPSALVLCIGIILLIHYRWHIKYKLFLLYRNYYPRPDNNEEDFEMLQLRYHAYVSYNDESRIDDDWVMNDLQPNMEEGPEPQKLFIKNRDFMPGQSLIEGISENIQQSRKTILVLSPRFVESQWCRHEMEMAQMRLLDEHLDVLVLVLLQEIPNDKMTLSLRKLLCKKKYLKWPKDRAGQRLFWQRLRQELKAPVQVDRRFH